MSTNANPHQSPRSVENANLPNSGESIIRVTRTKSYADRLRAFRIVVDGVERARIKAGESIDIPVDAGKHTVVAKVDWCGSNPVNLTTEVNSTITLECASNLQGSRIFLAMFYITLFRDRYLTLTQT